MDDVVAQTPETIFGEAIEIASRQDRSLFLDGACQGNVELRRDVDRLVEDHFRAGSFLESPAADLAVTTDHRPITERPGTTIGPYKLLQQIGEGGMGVVFMAEQTEPIQRTVALKIIKPGMDTRQVIARFEAERQALAMMDHPNIAKVLDAGTTDTGRPYFVMELVKGVPITKYCDEKHLPLRARLELLLPVCQAVQHAHQKGVIHRDIKPTNVLVAEYDDQAVPKVIDFGVAKATAQKLTDRTMFTEFGQVVGTVEYMSPEQAKFNQLDIDTRSDIYSLGVLLYELLTGSTPFGRKRLTDAAFDEALRIIREEEPQKPSTRLTTTDQLPSIAANRHSEPARLSKDVRGELDWVVMKALEKDRNRRYDTAGNFAADVLRHLSDQPVEACPPSAVYRFRKFVRRNRAALTTAVLVSGALVLGTVISTWQAIRATRAEQVAKAAQVAEAEQRTEAERQSKQAEAGRAAEVTLRQNAETREKITKASVLYEAGKYEESENLLNEIPPSLRQPDFVHARLRRLLGSQHAIRNEWKQAATDFSILMQINSSDTLDNRGLDFLRYGPVLIELGDTTLYDQFVQTTIADFADTNDPVTAERVCRVCLLLPADSKRLGQLDALPKLVVRTQSESTDLITRCWSCISMAIVEYRRGKYAKAVKWSSVSLDTPKGTHEVWGATAHVVRSMAYHQLHQETEAKFELSSGREMIDAAFNKGLDVSPYNITSFDWMHARILSREAEKLLTSKPAANANTERRD